MPPPRPAPVIIDAAFFPHIIDEIFKGAPLASLLVLRCVSRNWNIRASRQIQYHLVLEDGDNTSVRPGLASDGAFVFRAPDFLRCYKEKWPFAVNTRVYDFAGPQLSRQTAGLLFAWQPGQVDTLRFMSSCQIGDVRLPRFALKRVVYFDYKQNVGPVYKLDGLGAVRVVVHLSAPSVTPSWMYRSIGLWMQTLVIILHPWTARPYKGKAGGWERVEQALRQVLGELLYLVKSCKDGNHSIIIVGLERLTHTALGFTTEDSLEGRSVEEAAVEFINNNYPLHPRDPPGSYFNYSIKFKGMDEYKREVGIRNFEIETEETFTHHPAPVYPWGYWFQ